MELFERAKHVRLRSVRDKFLVAFNDQETVCQDRDGTTRNAHWEVILVPGENFIRLKSCYGKYLTASNIPFLQGVTGKRVLQSNPTSDLDGSIDWEPLRDGFQVRLRTRTGNFLRPNGGLPPWRNSITHDTPRRTSTQEKILWDVEVAEILSSRHHHRAYSETRFNKSRSTSAMIITPSVTRLEDLLKRHTI